MAPPAEMGSEVPEILTEHLGFKVLGQGKAGPKKVKILPEPWPVDSVPPAYATLLSVASKVGLLAAAGPKSLVVTSTEGVRKAFQSATKSGTDKEDDRGADVVSDFAPDVVIDVPTLRHVAFSTDGEFLAISSEEQGRILIFDVEAFVQRGDRGAKQQLETDGVPLRQLVPNPAPDTAHYFAAVYENGKLVLFDAANGKSTQLRDGGVRCVDWSTRGKAVLIGLEDGSAAIHLTDGTQKAVIPRPPDLDDSYTLAGLTFLDNLEFFMVHSVRVQEIGDPQDNKYHVVKSTKQWASYTYHPTAYDPALASFDIPSRSLPPRFSVKRLRHWKPDLEDMLIVTTSHTDSIALLASSSAKLAADQEVLNQLTLIETEDGVKASAPRTVYDEETDSVFIGEALDLSSKEKILRPIAALEEISEAPWPLPAYMALTHEGLLSAWWILWNRSIEAGERYPGLVVGSEQQQSETPAATPAKPAPVAASQTPSTFGQPQSTTPATSAFARPAATFGTPTMGSPTPGLMKPTPPGFGTPGFGAASTSLPAPNWKSSQPAFGASSTMGKPAQPAFGAPSAIGKPAQPTFGAPSGMGKPAQPAFGAPSSIPTAGGAPFGSVGGFGSKSSPWGAPAQASQTQSSPFAAAAGESSGFAKFNQTSQTSSFSSFGSNTGNQTGFGAFGQGQQKTGFGSLKPEPSFGSTVTVDSGTGSTLPSWANTPAQSSGGIFGQNSKSSFNTSSFESKQSDDSSDVPSRQRDEATPTPQNPPAQKPSGLFGLAGGFKLGTTFSSDGTAKDDPSKPGAPANGSFFGSDFGNLMSGSGLKPPATPLKETPEDVSTTPASPPKQQSFFPSMTPAKESATPKAAPPPEEKPVVVDDAPLPPDPSAYKAPKMDDLPLPPDFVTSKPKKSAEDDLPPLAGSPPVKIEAPSSDAEESPEEEGDESDFSDEGEDEEEAEEEEGDDSSPVEESPVTHQPQVAKSSATSQFGRSASPAQQPSFGQSSRPVSAQPSSGGSSLFGQQVPKDSSLFANKQTPSLFANKPAPSAAAKPSFPPPVSQSQSTLRTISPIRSASASGPRTRKEQSTSPGALFNAALQQPKPSTPQPQISDLEDEEDERMRERLAQPIEPSRTLDDFVAYQNYAGEPAGKTGHAAQIEAIYRDINGMVDALGWNARSVKSFTQYHKTPRPGHTVDRDVLDRVIGEGEEGSWFEDFAFCEIEALKALEDELEQELDAERVQDVLDKLQQLARLLREKAKLMTRLNDIRRQIIHRKDPEKTEAVRKAPLPKELAEGQKSLRHDYAQLLISLSKAEDAIISLRSSVASYNAQNGKTSAVPTMDAVRRTCLKLAAMAETKNNDIVLLESQLKKVGLSDPSRHSSSPSRTAATPRRTRTNMRSSIAESPFVTPPTNRSTMSLKELNRRALTPDAETTPTASKGYGLVYTPEGSPTGNELARMSDVVDDNMKDMRETAHRRKQVAAGLKKALIERGVKTTRMN